MSDLIGSLKDFRPQAIGNSAEVIFTPYGPAVSTSKSLLVPKEIRVSPAADGAFTVALASWAGTNPSTAYKMRVEWTPPGMAFPIVEEIPWPIVVTGNGQLTDMFSIETAPGQFTTKGDKGDDGDSVMQEAFDDLVARMPQPGASDAFEVADKNGQVSFSANADSSVNVGDTQFVPTKDYQWVDLDGYVAGEIKNGRWYIYDPAFSTRAATEGTSFIKPVKVLHLFLAAGQSNMAGRAPVDPSIDVPDARIFQYGSTRKKLETATVPLDMADALTATKQGLSPATTFSRNYLTMQPANVGVLIVPAAFGGRGFTTATDIETWTPNAATNPDYDLPKRAVDRTLEAIAAATAAGYIVEFKAILWHQGEANNSMSQASYATNFDALISYFKTQLSAPNVAVVVGQMCPEGMDDTPGKYNVDAAHQATPARLAYSGFAPATRGGYNVPDTTHFSRTGIEYLGHTYLSGFWQAVGNVLGAPPSAPVGLSATKAGTSVTVTWNAPPAALTAVQTFGLYGAGNGIDWTAPASHIDAYKVETKTGAGAWTVATRAKPMNLSETVTVPAGTTQVRVTALNGATASTPATTTAIGA